MTELEAPDSTGELSDEEQDELKEVQAQLQRKLARFEILSAANQILRDNNSPRRPLGMRNIHRAVCIARRNRVIANEILVDAGFNPYKQ